MKKITRCSLVWFLVSLGLAVGAPAYAKKKEVTDMSQEMIDAYNKAPCKQIASGGIKSKNYNSIRLYLIDHPEDRQQILNEVMPYTTAKMQQCGLL